jgi:hypothetical protein
MKTALLMFGQPRYVEEHFPNIKRCLIEPNNPDVHVHTWISSTDKPFRVGEGWKNERLTKDALTVINDLYRPKSILAQSQIDFPDKGIDFTSTLNGNMGGGAERPEIAAHYIFATYSMWYSIAQVFKLIETRSYDAIILTRFDLGIQRPVKIMESDLDCIYGEDIGRPELLLNWMNFGGSDYMRQVFGEMYTDIGPMYRATNIWCNEYWCKYACTKYGIPVKTGSWGLTIPSRKL